MTDQPPTPESGPPGPPPSWLTPTQPVAPPGAESSPSYPPPLPASTERPPAQPLYPSAGPPPAAALSGYPPPGPPTPEMLAGLGFGVPLPPTRSARPAGWMWPAVAVLALALGVGGGFAGSAIYHRTSHVPGGTAEGLAGSGTVTTSPLAGRRTSVAKVAKALLPSTVQISAEYGGQDGGATGSGFVLDSSGHVITNNHVVEQAAKDDGLIEVVDQEGHRYRATIVGRSPVYDLAVLYAKRVDRLQPASLGSAGSLQVGDPVVAFGSPLGLSSTVTAGIVSALERPVTTGDSPDEESYIDAVQTDAAINPGNSGGPLVDMAGQVVGVNSAIATTGGGSTTGAQSGNIGVGFAIPIAQVKVTADQILRTGEASYPVIGARVRTNADDDGSGATVIDVVGGGPAARGGLKTDDLVLAIDGQRVSNGIALIVAIRAHQPGEDVELTVRRASTSRMVTVTLGSETG